ncbi:MAG TPA: hypothetical protein VLS25_00920 [Dehalococcoidia bacterium]|nr:hypothetical protein [Dehalococcoidia bacterium]
MTQHTNNTRHLALGFLALALLLAGIACGGDNSESGTSPSAAASETPEATLLPPDPASGAQAFQGFVEAVQANDAEKAWGMYAASVSGSTDEHDSTYGCDFSAFSFEFPRMQHLFARMVPFQVTETYSAAPGSRTIEMRLKGADGTSFLGTVVRVQNLEGYRVQFLNSGEVSRVPGAPDPQPSPEDPLGVCGIWTGGR